MPLLSIVMRWIHIGGVVTAVGGIVFVRFVLGPALAQIPAAMADTVRAAVMRRFVPLLHTALYAILASGFYNMFHLRPRVGDEIRVVYVSTFFVKIALVSILFTFAFMLTSNRRREWVEARRSALFLTNVVLAGAIIAISAFLRSLR